MTPHEMGMLQPATLSSPFVRDSAQCSEHEAQYCRLLPLATRPNCGMELHTAEYIRRRLIDRKNRGVG
jgi:hypothetical protein